MPTINPILDIIIVEIVSRIGHQNREVLKRSWYKAFRGITSSVCLGSLTIEVNSPQQIIFKGNPTKVCADDSLYLDHFVHSDLFCDSKLIRFVVINMYGRSILVWVHCALAMKYEILRKNIWCFE